jgi:uncharacterized membrane protein
MRRQITTALLSTGLLVGTFMPPAVAATRTPQQQVRHKRHIKTAKRVGIGAAGGAVAGALVGHPVAGAAVGAGAGALYDRHKKHTGHN